MADMFSNIDDLITTLNSVKTYLDETCISLENKTQAEVDKIIVEKINPTINGLLADLRSGCISTLQSMYGAYTALAEKITPVAEANPTNLTSVIDFCLAVKDFLVAAYQSIVLFMTQLIAKLAELNTAITSLVNYTPPISGLDFSKLNIQMQSISLSDITGGSE